MSRSFRKKPARGITNAASEKEDKRLAHRADRATVRSALDKGEEDVFDRNHHRSGGWTFAKDGRVWLKKPDPKDLRK